MTDLARLSEQHHDARGRAATQTARLLTELSPNSDLGWLVERVSRDKVSEWLALHSIAIVRI